MGLIVPEVFIDRTGVASNVTLSNAYIAIADYDVSFRNYKNAFAPTDCNGMPVPTNYPDGVQINVQYGIWESYQSRTDSNFPIQVLCTKVADDSNAVGGSNLYTYAYDVIKTTYSNATDFL
jgi:hypothetical protein